jgi:hypothetical protein
MLAAAWLCNAAAIAQQPAPAGVDLRTFAAKRFPQPVRVGDLIHRAVLEPVESRRLLGRVNRVIRRADGADEIVIEFGGFWGIDRRNIAVPAEAMVLLGDELEVLDFTPQQLRRFPTYNGAGSTALGADEVIRMGLAHPSH